jgi:hypothetical protein
LGSGGRLGAQVVLAAVEAGQRHKDRALDSRSSLISSPTTIAALAATAIPALFLLAVSLTGCPAPLS